MVFPLFPPAASTTAEAVDRLFALLISVCGVFLFAIFNVINFFLLKYRRGKPAERSQRTFSTIPLELTWTIVPLFVFMGFFLWGADIYNQEKHIPVDAMEIHVIGKQWMWTLQHATGQREMDELHVPIGRNVKLVMATQDVIHSFFMPAFRIKQDLIPGRYTAQWFRAKNIGNFPIYCSEYCGAFHSFMVGRVIVMSPQDYQTWLDHRQPRGTLVERGAALYRELGCSGCHEGTSRVVRAPPLEGLYNRPVPLQNGRIVTADEQYIHDSIVYPKRQIVASYEPVMPSFLGQVSEEQIFELVDYIKSLSDKTPQSPARQGKMP